ncbi:MAG: sel1 repeat family protein [Xanthobacteraceae bacterium]|nr:sel1 repeat family protein [Xanthobacteraceae bacterium]
MRISELIRTSAAAALVLTCAGSAIALDPQKQSAPSSAVAPAKPTEILDAFKSGTQAYIAGDRTKGLTALQYAAENGHPIAQWKLGRIYADGDGVKADPYKAFQYFSQVASKNAETSPFLPQARFVANAFVALGNYHLEGIPNTEVRSDPRRAVQLFRYAATYFGDADAQYQLARLYLEGRGAQKDPRTAARWLYSAANKGQYRAQALLGQMMVHGEGLPKQAARGLMWLTLAADAAKEQGDEWIQKAYDDAIRETTQDDRIVARSYLEQHLRANR